VKWDSNQMDGRSMSLGDLNGAGYGILWAAAGWWRYLSI
jgi:hypothetical protein